MVTFQSRLACQHFITQLFIGHLPRKYNRGKGMLFSVEQAFVGRDEKRAPLKRLRGRLEELGLGGRS